jgi:iron complex outermembrane receptor protein
MDEFEYPASRLNRGPYGCAHRRGSAPLHGPFGLLTLGLVLGVADIAQAAPDDEKGSPPAGEAVAPSEPAALIEPAAAPNTPAAPGEPPPLAPAASNTPLSPDTNVTPPPETPELSSSSPDVVVIEHKESSKTDYRVEKADMGPLGRRAVLDLPFAVYSVPKELLGTQMIHETNEAMQFIPSLQMEARFGMEFGPPIVRGFEVDDNSENTRIDGMNVRADTALPLDLYESYEVLTGPAGSLYGPTYAGGMINATLKRPTDRAFQQLSYQFQGSDHSSVQVDVGGRFGPRQMFGYRVNGVHATGGMYAPGSNLERELGSVAFDVRLPTHTVVEVLASDYDYRQWGYPGGFTYGGTTGSTGLPSAPDPKLAGLGASWSGMVAETRLLELAAHQSIGEDWRVDAGILHQIADREFHNMMTHTFSDDAGDYTTTYRQSGSRGDVLSNKAYVNGTVATGAVRQDIAVGTNGFRADAYSKPQIATGTLSLGPGSLDAPTLGAEPGWVSPGPQYKTTTVKVQSLVLNDTVSLGPKVSVLLGGSLGWLDTHNFNATGATTSEIKADEQLSGAAALMVKPRADMTAYVNYADSIQPGESASACTGDATRDLTNCGQTLSPERSQQFEVGYKWTLAQRLDLTTAAFRIRRPFAYTNATTRVFEVEGEQVNRGLELTARGDAHRSLTVVAGLTLLDPKLEQTQSAATTGKQVVGIPTVRGNLLIEYRLPWLPGLAVDGAVHGRNRVPGNAANTTWAGHYATFDASVRYTYRMSGVLATANLGVSNLTNASYWASVRGSVSGDPAGSNSAFLGSPRVFRFGLQLDI